MRLRLSPILVVLGLAPLPLYAQGGSMEDVTRVLLLEHTFTSAADSAVTELRKGVMYWAEVDGPGAPDIRSVRRYGHRALVVDTDTTSSTARWFEVHVGQNGSYVVRLTQLSPGDTTTLKLYRDDPETRRLAELHDRDFTMGVFFGGGGHTGYRLEPSLDDPGSGRQFEGGLITQTGGIFSALIGLSRHSLHDPDFAIPWFFLEPRVLLKSGHFLGRRRTDVTLTLRLAAAPESGPHHLPPNVWAPGITLTHHLSSEGRRRGLSLYAAWRHGWISNVPESQRNETNEFTAGLAWLP
ncbi:MAG TPA: hypothetical protein VJQ46_00605 [Gemmatimonadales bacterium]|nr:hypothetical protein [Gemmatimonadales bacterium]